MAESPIPPAIAIAAPASRSVLREVTPIIISIISTLAMLVTFFVAVGSWRATVDQTLKDLDRRLAKAEGNQEKYIPVLVGMTKDLSYLADRARREDERRDRELARRDD